MPAEACRPWVPRQRPCMALPGSARPTLDQGADTAAQSPEFGGSSDGIRPMRPSERRIAAFQKLNDAQGRAGQ